MLPSIRFNCISTRERSSTTLSWVVSESHITAPHAFREPLPGSEANPSNRSRYRQYKFVANSAYRTCYPPVAGPGIQALPRIWA
jgi:hypothetical protein